MKELATLHKPKASEGAVSQQLQQVLNNTYGLYLATHNYHWNVEGENFVSLHKIFGDQYEELFEAVDVIAERIRALNSYALPFEGDEIMGVLKTISNAMNKETDANARATRMVRNLIEINENVIETCQSAKHEAQAKADDESENLMVERITAHQKALWMLNSITR